MATSKTELKKQKTVRPQIEVVIANNLIGESLESAKAFVAYIRANKMTPSWASTNSWKVNYKGKALCYIRLHGAAHYEINSEQWHLAVFAQYDQHLHELIKNEDDMMKNLVKSHINSNLPCGGCMPELDRYKVNEEFINRCACTSININNPTVKMIEFAQKLIMLRRDAIAKGRVPKCNYLKPADRK